ncbi:hypothetical protein F4780DRAFT_554508 [Xylariomycetidae sp. FL0641]|nr:hypothetical protein F4780DRAFT_554508 [Xylariomycetidae sp. FL0641]
MDHLPLPRSPAASGAISVPFLAGDPYDKGSFQDYPKRNGWTILGYHQTMNITHNGCEVDVLETASMLQTWLFFGLVFAVTGEVCDPQDFCKLDENGNKLLSTASLGTIIGGWSQRSVSGDWSAWEKHLSAAYNDLLMARVTTLRIKSTPRYADLDLLCMSIALLGEYLNQAMKDIFLKRPLPPPVQQSWRVPGFADCGAPLITSMISKGWCPHKIAGLDASYPKVVGTLWFFANIKPPRPHLDHKGCCSPSSCSFIFVEKIKYEIKHQEPGCECQMVGPPHIDLRSALEDERIPIVTVDPSGAEEGERLSVRAEPYSSGEKFIAISHVWADGHGNPDRNELPSCFLNDLTALLGRIQPNPQARPVKFWMDTLCVPREPRDLKNMALQLLKEPYELASHVLVINTYLATLNSASMLPLEVVAHIEASEWSQRLWTFKEGRLGCERMWFQFQDRAVNLFDLIENGWREDFYRIPSTPSHSVELDILGGYNSSTIWNDPKMTQPTKQVPYMRHSLSTRTTTKADDEAICLVNILGLPIKPILDVEGDDRMRVFWSLLPRVPEGMVFSMATRKLTMPGYRWAPASLMGDLEVRRWGGPEGSFERNTAKPSDTGLDVNLFMRPIIPVKSFPCPTGEEKETAWNVLRGLLNQATSCYGSLPLRDEAGDWYECSLKNDWHQDTAVSDMPTDEVAVLLPRPGAVFHDFTDGARFDSLWQEEGILVTHNGAAGQTSPTTARAHRHVRLIKQHPAVSDFYERLWILSQTIMKVMEARLPTLGSEESGASIILQNIARLVKEDEGLLELAKRINEVNGEDAKEESVLKEIMSRVCLFLVLFPWLGTTSASSRRRWCIS